MTNQVIPDEAVKAAAKMSYYIESGQQWEALEPERQRELLSKTYSILEAAAPHISAEAWEVGMAAAKLQAAGIKPARNPYRPTDAV